MLTSPSRDLGKVLRLTLLFVAGLLVLVVFSVARISRTNIVGATVLSEKTPDRRQAVRNHQDAETYISIHDSILPLKYDAPATDKPGAWIPKPGDRGMTKEYVKVSHTPAYANLRAKSSFLNIDLGRRDFEKYAVEVCIKHGKQTEAEVRRLNNIWEGVVLIGDHVSTWDLIEKLSLTVDRSDRRVFLVNQYQHVLQIWEAMVLDNIDDEMLLAFAVIHDIGKLVSLFGEEDHNADCITRVIRKPEMGVKGMHNFVVTWNHDEFGYLKLRKYLPENMAWMLRYHSLSMLVSGQLDEYLTDQEKTWLQTLQKFEIYDHQVKSLYRLPRVNVSIVKQVVLRFLPEYIEF